MNWKKIAKTFPTAMEALYDWLDVEEIQSSITNTCISKFEVFTTEMLNHDGLLSYNSRALYEFFDKYNLFISVDIVFGGEDAGRFYCDITDLHTMPLKETNIKSSRIEAEEEVFWLAFNLLEKQLTYKDSDIIGFISSGKKGYIVYTGSTNEDGNRFCAVDIKASAYIPNNSFGDSDMNNHKSIQEAVEYLKKTYSVQEFIKFPTQAMLHEWLTN